MPVGAWKRPEYGPSPPQDLPNEPSFSNRATRWFQHSAIKLAITKLWQAALTRINVDTYSIGFLPSDNPVRRDRALIERANVIPDFRAPDVIRLAPVAAYTRFVDVWEAMDRLRRLLEAGEHVELPEERARVT